MGFLISKSATYAPIVSQKRGPRTLIVSGGAEAVVPAVRKSSDMPTRVGERRLIPSRKQRDCSRSIRNTLGRLVCVGQIDALRLRRAAGFGSSLGRSIGSSPRTPRDVRDRELARGNRSHWTSTARLEDPGLSLRLGRRGIGTTAAPCGIATATQTCVRMHSATLRLCAAAYSWWLGVVRASMCTRDALDSVARRLRSFAGTALVDLTPLRARANSW